MRRIAPWAAGGLGALVFLSLGLFVLDLGLILSLGVGVLGFVGSWLLARPPAALPVPEHFQDQVGLVLSACDQGRVQLEQYLPRLAGSKASGSLKNILDHLGQIRKDVLEDPKDAKTASRFLDYYLDTTLKILAQYTSIRELKKPDPALVAVLGRAEGSLELLDQAFARHLSQLKSDNLLELDTEIKVLEATLGGSGLLEDLK